MAEDTRSGEAPPMVSGTDLRTFLIADVRGYTRFTREHGDEAASALARRFAALVRDVVPDFAGELLELRGDEALCVFGSARQAIRASVELQRRLRTPDPDAEPFPVGVGIGLDAGEAVPTEGGYRGDALNLAARLCGIAKPGQILASDGVVHLARRVDGVRLGPRKTARLKGMDDPVRFVEVIPEVPLPAVPAALPHARRPKQRRAILVGIIAILVISGLVVALHGRGGTAKRAATPAIPPNSLVALNPQTLRAIHVTRVGIGVTPARLAYGDGYLWTYNSDTQNVYRIDARTYGVYQVGIGGQAISDIATSPGHAWAADPYTNSLVDINSTSPTVRQRIPLDNHHGQGFSGNFRIATAGQRVWVTQTSGWVVVNASTDHVTPHRYPGRFAPQPQDVAIGDHQLWFVFGGYPPHVFRVAPVLGQPRSQRTVATPYQPACCAPGGDLAVGYDYAWYALGYELWKISPSPVTAQNTIPLRGDGESITTGGGYVWVGDAATGDLIRINPSTNAKTIIHLGKTISGVAFGAGRVWATVQ